MECIKLKNSITFKKGYLSKVRSIAHEINSILRRLILLSLKKPTCHVHQQFHFSNPTSIAHPTYHIPFQIPQITTKFNSIKDQVRRQYRSSHATPPRINNRAVKAGTSGLRKPSLNFHFLELNQQPLKEKYINILMLCIAV